MVYGRRARLLSLAGLVVALTAPPARAQADAVELLFQLKPEETLRYTVVRSSMHWGQVYVNGVARTFLSRDSTTLREDIRVEGVGEDGTMSLEVTQQEIQTTRASGLNQALPHFNGKIRTNGEVVETGVLGPRYFHIGLPGRAVSPGESWTYKQKGVSWDITEESNTILGTDITFTATLVSVDRAGGDQVAHVQIKGEGMIDSSAAYRTFEGSVLLKGRSPIHVSGEAAWSIGTGRLIRLREETSFEFPVEVVFQGQKFDGKGKLTLTEEREPLSSPN